MDEDRVLTISDQIVSDLVMR